MDGAVPRDEVLELLERDAYRWSNEHGEHHRRNHQPFEEDACAQQLVRDYPSGMTLEMIGAYMGLTRERVRQIERLALIRLERYRGADSRVLHAYLMAKRQEVEGG